MNNSEKMWVKDKPKQKEGKPTEIDDKSWSYSSVNWLNYVNIVEIYYHENINSCKMNKGNNVSHSDNGSSRNFKVYLYY